MSMEERKKLQEKLTVLWPDDSRLRNAILMGVGVCDQLPVLVKALKDQLTDLPQAGDTQQWEDLTHLAVADCVAWSTRLEIALHDLRSAIFFRVNNRFKVPLPPAAAEERAHMERNKLEAKAKLASAARDRAADNAPPPPDPAPPRAAKNITSMFGDLGKNKR